MRGEPGNGCGTLRRVLAALDHAGVPVVHVASFPRHGHPANPEATDVDLLVPARHGRTARRVLEALDWLYALGASGAWRAVPVAVYLWGGGPGIYLHWRLPTSPLPSLVLRPLERRLWSTARRREGGSLRPDEATLLVYHALQCGRPDTAYHDGSWRELTRLSSDVRDWPAVWALAREAGLEATVRAALREVGGERRKAPVPLLPDRPVPRALARGALAAQRRVWPRRARFVLGGAPQLGVAPTRSRIGGVTTLSPSAVFVPTQEAETIAELAVDRLSRAGDGLVIDCGSGNGAIALAIAAARPESSVLGSELSLRAVRAARRNRRRLGLTNARFFRGSLLDPLPVSARGRAGTLVANLPFYPRRSYAPIGGVARAAIEGADDDGLGLYRRLAAQASPWLTPGAVLFLQMFDWQWSTFESALTAAGFEPTGSIPGGPFVIGSATWRDRTERRD